MRITMHKSVLSTEVSTRMSNLYLPSSNRAERNRLQPGDTTCLECKRNRQNTSLSQKNNPYPLSHSNISIFQTGTQSCFEFEWHLVFLKYGLNGSQWGNVLKCSILINNSLNSTSKTAGLANLFWHLGQWPPLCAASLRPRGGSIPILTQVPLLAHHLVSSRRIPLRLRYGSCVWSNDSC